MPGSLASRANTKRRAKRNLKSRLSRRGRRQPAVSNANRERLRQEAQAVGYAPLAGIAEDTFEMGTNSPAAAPAGRPKSVKETRATKDPALVVLEANVKMVKDELARAKKVEKDARAAIRKPRASARASAHTNAEMAAARRNAARAVNEASAAGLNLSTTFTKAWREPRNTTVMRAENTAVNSKEAALEALPNALARANEKHRLAVNAEGALNNLGARSGVLELNAERASRRVAGLTADLRHVEERLRSWKAAHAPGASRGSRAAAVPRTTVTRAIGRRLAAAQANNMPPAEGGRRTRRNR